MSASFFNFRQFSDNDPGRFNNAVSGGGMLPPGEHDVKISEITVFEQRQALRVKLENAEGKSSSAFVPLYEQDRKSGQFTSNMHFKFGAFLRAITGSSEKALELRNLLPEAPQLLQSLNGLKLKVVVEKGVNGYTVVQKEGKLQLIDAGAGECTAVLQQLVGDRLFDSYNEIKEFAAGAGNTLKRAYDNVTQFHPASDEAVNANLSALQTAKEAILSSGAGAGGVGIAAVGGVKL